ncbi:MAG: hypothetical protein CYPHOPRED_003266 [Cyphobasidiales sp. Tagirdzhanova-0007]|nr:MAG: hypothetical protein CYPHOPRED_003266 [Cyphobasidiales sp. Tagirdzhanova-0007]
MYSSSNAAVERDTSLYEHSGGPDSYPAVALEGSADVGSTVHHYEEYRPEKAVELQHVSSFGSTDSDGTEDYRTKPTISDKIAGTIEEIKGVITHNPGLKEDGKLRKHGEFTGGHDF